MTRWPTAGDLGAGVGPWLDCALHGGTESLTQAAVGFSEEGIEDELAQEAAQRSAQGGTVEAGQDVADRPRAAAGTGSENARADAEEGLTLNAQIAKDLRTKTERETAPAAADLEGD